ncbi:hypothetical protein CcrC1_gp242c [Caulobacter phage C1]|nr:hypothetical protein CcrC1_gp242c [Caulobacter phage C1]UTU08471.1 hypothetical protein CcrC2_gp243c [Caulobacter phage C2]UTU08986.1 hypothetical protein CcrJ4_gp237c [Caulobacter phage J4]UTU09547.1 hypothetical protein CcrBL47_gp261c [Caulobacter phage BL47]UTU10104.1 hypothetical protein CcrRB23_gp242c [Caulobacter phage RB23]WGN97139.1 hypothetical protein [Bertelyvirus sp.]
MLNIAPPELTDAGLSAERIESAPVVIRSLFREFNHTLVFNALEMVGIDCDPATLSEEVVEAGAKRARELILGHISDHISELLTDFWTRKHAH